MRITMTIAVIGLTMISSIREREIDSNCYRKLHGLPVPCGWLIAPLHQCTDRILAQAVTQTLNDSPDGQCAVLPNNAIDLYLSFDASRPRFLRVTGIHPMHQTRWNDIIGRGFRNSAFSPCSR